VVIHVRFTNVRRILEIARASRALFTEIECGSGGRGNSDCGRGQAFVHEVEPEGSSSFKESENVVAGDWLPLVQRTGPQADG